mmetsp:Transcript_131994/g.422742  ORF Transcript_131994/g.422742 Transcript_131994/m.422742 type:complete len:202 (+) Transcript_131994:1220-1825(+)
MEVAWYSEEISAYITIDPNFRSLVHGNLAADNAWYWRDEKGQLQCGLLDFGGFGPTNIATTQLMSWTMAEPEMLKDHWLELADAFLDGVRESNGPSSITREEYLTSLGIAFAKVSALCGGSTLQLLKIMPMEQWAQAKDRWDPVVNDRFLNRNYTCAIRTGMLVWKYCNLYDRFLQWRRENAWLFENKKPFVCPDFPEILR